MVKVTLGANNRPKFYKHYWTPYALKIYIYLTIFLLAYIIMLFVFLRQKRVKKII